MKQIFATLSAISIGIYVDFGFTAALVMGIIAGIACIDAMLGDLLRNNK